MKNNIFKRLKFFAAALLIIPSSFMLSACKDGQTPYIGENGNWFIGSTDTGVKASGENGTNGTNGLDGKDAEQIDTYEMYLNAVEHEDYQGSYLDFIKENFSVNTDVTAAVANSCALSIVEVKAYNNTSNVGSGSGIIYQIDDDGNALVLTNYHVVVGAGTTVKSKFDLRLYGQQENTYIHAEFVGGSSDYDIAILKVTESDILKSSGAKAVTFNTTAPTLGETCIAIGNPNTYGIAVNKGVVSVENEYVYMTVAGERMLRRLLRHDAFIAGGSSGGGLFDINGMLIGMTCGGQDGTDIHYAIPASLVHSVVNSILRNVDNGGIKPTTAVLGIEIDFTAQPSYNASTGLVEISDTITISAINNGLIKDTDTFAIGDQLVSITINPDTQNEHTIVLSREYQLAEVLLTIPANTVIKINCLRGTEPISATLLVTASNIVAVK